MTRLEVLHLDNHLLAVAKPAGVPVVPDASGDESLLDQAKAWLKRELAKPGEAFLGVVHRLDRPVSGVVLFARTSKAAARLGEQLRNRSVAKLYLAIGEGAPHGESGELEQWLSKDERLNVVTSVGADREGAKRALTRWRVLETRDRRTLLELEPLTGRAHQLRVAAATLGCPLMGDLKYGATAALPDRSVALHAWSLDVDHPTTRTRVRIVGPPPERPWWRDWGDRLRPRSESGR